MIKRAISTAAIFMAWAAPAQAVTFFSIGGAPDPGIAQFETAIVTFDAPMHAGIIETRVGPVGVFRGSSSSAAAPAQDTGFYEAVGTGGSATFDFRGYFASRSSAVRSLSVYIGSVDQYNFIEVLDLNLAVVSTIHGSDLPGSNGDQGAAFTNRRLYIGFDPSEAIGGLRFGSSGVAFEFDTIAASSAFFHNNGNATPTSLPVATAVPEPSTWTLLVAGIGLVGIAMRRRKAVVVVTS